MKIVAQRVEYAKVEVNNEVVGSIDNGLMLLVSFTHTDTEKNVDYMVKKVLGLRVFDDENGVMNKNVLETNGSILSISQFTLYGELNKGNRPSYSRALNSLEASKLYDLFNKKLSEYISVSTGIFGADMDLFIENIGPTTILLER